jgi:hypothetical protein
MHDESHAIEGRASKPPDEQFGKARTIVRAVHAHVAHHVSRLCAFGRAVCAIWPVKPALHLSQSAHESERSAQYQINGERKASARAMHAVDGAMLDE